MSFLHNSPIFTCYLMLILHHFSVFICYLIPIFHLSDCLLGAYTSFLHSYRLHDQSSSFLQSTWCLFFIILLAEEYASSSMYIYMLLDAYSSFLPFYMLLDNYFWSFFSLLDTYSFSCFHSCMLLDAYSSLFLQSSWCLYFILTFLRATWYLVTILAVYLMRILHISSICAVYLIPFLRHYSILIILTLHARVFENSLNKMWERIQVRSGNF